jgi:hypothetical protein
VEKISGAKLEILGEGDDACALPIRLGLGRDPSLAEVIREEGDDPASFLLRVKEEGVWLAGLAAEGTLFAAYELLEQLGVRWLMPGEFGAEVPSSPDVALEVQETLMVPSFPLEVQETLMVPSFPTRLLQSVQDRTWERRMRLGGMNYGRHGFPVKYDPEKNPELFYDEGGFPTKKVRVSREKVLEDVIAASREKLRAGPSAKYLSMGPADGSGFGVDPWDAGDRDPIRGDLSVTDRYVKFFNLVLDGLEDEFPGTGIAFYTYSRYMRPPVRERPNAKLLPVLAPIDLCRLHSAENPLCPERQYLKRIVAGWKDLGNRMFYRGYFFNLADHGLPFSMIRQVREEIPYFHREGFVGMRVECMPMWIWHGPGLYLASKLMWDVEADAEEILEDWFRAFYGPAGEEAREYFRVLEEAYRTADFHTGNVFDIPHVLTAEVTGRLEGILSKAESKAGEGTYSKRAAALRLVHDYGMANLEMMAALRELRFGQARSSHDRVVALREKALEHDPPLLYARASRRYFERFWSPPVLSGYQRTSGGREMLAALPDGWLFQLDPHDGGEDLGFWKADAGGGNWTEILTRSRSWSGQGLRYYKGAAWYRTEAEVPALSGGRKAYLWLGGVDEEAKAWINGRELPVVAEGTAPIGRPWEFDATEALAPGRNTVVVKVVNLRLNELGTGGITGPAMLWSQEE